MHIHSVSTCLLLGLAVARAETLYDVTFSEPVHHVGLPATVSWPIDPRAPSSNVFGMSKVVDQLGGHSAVLQLIPLDIGTFQYSQYGFSLQPSATYQYLRAQFDVYVASMQPPSGAFYGPGPDDGFSFLFDTPSTVRLDFTGAGRILENGMDIGSFGMGSWLSMTVDIDLVQNLWDIYMDDVLVNRSQFFHPYPLAPIPPTSIENVRMNLADSKAYASTPEVYVDNIRLDVSPTSFATVPESINTAFALSGFLLFVAGGRVRPSKARR